MGYGNRFLTYDKKVTDIQGPMSKEVIVTSLLNSEPFGHWALVIWALSKDDPVRYQHRNESDRGNDVDILILSGRLLERLTHDDFIRVLNGETIDFILRRWWSH